MSQALSFCFKGKRTYVHGTDIVAELFKHFSDVVITDIDLKFNGIAFTNLNLVEGEDVDDAKVNIRLNLNGKEKVMQLVENGETPDCWCEYDEKSIREKCGLEQSNKLIYLKKVSHYTLCENFVAMNKFLLQSLYPEEKGKWYFTRLEQKRVIDEEALITVKLIKNFNFLLIKSNILVDDEVIGSVYFTLKRGE